MCVCVIEGERERATSIRGNLLQSGDGLQFNSWTRWIGVSEKVSASKKTFPVSVINKLVLDDNFPLRCVAVQSDRNVPFIRRQNPEDSKLVLQTYCLEHLRNIEIL